MTPEELERARLELERDRLAFEKSKADLSNNFFGRYSAILIPAAVSFAAVVVSFGQVWVTKITKDKEIEVATLQKRLELETQDAERKRELDISAARFVSENREAIFKGTPDEQELFAKLITTIFPVEVSGPLLLRLERASPAATKNSWQTVIEAAAGAAAFSPDGKLFVTTDRGGARIWDANSGRELRAFGSAEPLVSAQFSPDGRKLLTHSLGGAAQTWDLASGRLLNKTSE
jgi:WD40 repeat protein